jgi:dTDP-4-amino-4,6-dideoxygalactose transaminase
VLNDLNARRRDAAAMYRNLLHETDATPLAVSNRVNHVYHLFVIKHDHRDELWEFLEQRGISAIVHYPIPVHDQPAYDDHNPRHDLSVTERATSEILSLPIHPWVTDNEIEAVVDGIRKFETGSS